MQAPSNINDLKDRGQLEVIWRDGKSVEIPFFTLRDACKCARCVHEITGEKMLDPSTIPEDIHIESLSLVGNYALRVQWSHQHCSSIYTWERLAEYE